MYSKIYSNVLEVFSPNGNAANVICTLIHTAVDVSRALKSRLHIHMLITLVGSSLDW